MTREKDQKLTAAEKRWKRVASWTKNVNIFEKDFVIVPINEQSHWFLAIICFPSLKEPRTMDSDQPIKLLPLSKKKSEFKSYNLHFLSVINFKYFFRRSRNARSCCICENWKHNNHTFDQKR